MDDNCIFCRIIAGEFKTKFVYEDEYVVAFADINPVAPVHFLIVPRQHIANVLELNALPEVERAKLLISVQQAATVLSAQYGVDKTGFCLLTNCGSMAGQTVFHLHYHLIGERVLTVAVDK